MNLDFKQKTLKILAKFIARFCVKHSLTIQDLILQLKKSLIDEARFELARYKDEANASRISLLTGIHRQEVIKLSSTEEESNKSQNSYLLDKVIYSWLNKKPFCQKLGVAKSLTFDGDSSEFFKLVRLHNKDLSPYTILRELERIGSVEFHSDRVNLRRQELVPVGDLDAGLALFEKDLNSLINAIEHNLNSNNKPHMMHFRTEYDSIPQKQFENIVNWLMKKGLNNHKEARDYLSKLDQGDLTSSDNKLIKVSYSSFGYIEVPEEVTVVRKRKPGRKKK
jgi:hypothetical protein